MTIIDVIIVLAGQTMAGAVPESADTLVDLNAPECDSNWQDRENCKQSWLRLPVDSSGRGQLPVRELRQGNPSNKQ